MSRERSTLGKKFDVWIIFLGLLLVFFILSPDFRSVGTIKALLLLIPTNGVISVGMTLVILIGELDLSCGAVLASSGLIMAKLLPYGLPIAILAALGWGGLIGFINGWSVSRLKMNSLIVTLATTFIVGGLSLLISDGPRHFDNQFLRKFGNEGLLSIPYTVMVFFFLVILFQILLKKTRFGLNIYAVGGNHLAAHYAGINVEEIQILVFVLSGLLSSLGGIILSSRLLAAGPIYGQEAAIVAITSVLIGGTALGGGRGDTVKTFWGVMILGILTKGMNLLLLPAYFQDMIVGSILILTLISSRITQKKETTL